MPPSVATSTPAPLPVQGLRPTTFLERGASVPFTTPYLVGARLRPAARGVAELIVANAAGGPGVYITSWGGVQAMCSPTLHDRRLNAKFLSLPGISPAAMRRLAYDVAEEGLAGREAAAAAKKAREQEEQDRLRLNVELLIDVIRLVEQRDRGWSPPDLADRGALDRRARAALDHLAPRIGRPVDTLFQIIGEIAAAFGVVGLERLPGHNRLTRLIASVAELPQEMGEWPYARGEDGTLDTVLVHEAAALAVALAGATLGHARALLDDLPRLIRRWIANRDDVRRLAVRPEWVLDGWERICLLWHVAETTFGRPLALREAVGLLPMMPLEAAEWAEAVGVDSQVESLMRRRKTASGEDWRTGVTQADLIARNERLRAMAPGGPA